MEKQGSRTRSSRPRTLISGLAGGALSVSSWLAIENGAPEVFLPSRETVLITAVQSALREIGPKDAADALTLVRSDGLAFLQQNSDGAALATASDDDLRLRLSSMMPRARDTSSSEGQRPLRLSQMVNATAPGMVEPRWMTRPDRGGQLRSSRELSQPLPGAAGVGQAVRVIPVESAVSPGISLSQTTGIASPVVLEANQQSSSTMGAADNATKKTDTYSLGAFGWEIPPIRWGGSLGYTHQRSSNNSGYSSNSNSLFGNLSAASYIYAPWFARVSARLGVTSSSSSGSGPGDNGIDSSKNSNIVGGGEVNMFSSSRYPFRAYFDRTDSRSAGILVTNDYISNRFGMSQNFRSLDGMSGGNLLFDRSEVNSSIGRRDEVTALSGGYSTQTGVVQNSLNGRYSMGQRSGTGDYARLLGVNSSHIANISDTLNFGATVNYSDNNIRTSSGGGDPSASRGRYLQLYTYGSWLPDFEDLDDLPLTLNGGLRYTSQETQFGGEGFSAQSVGANLSALYRYSSRLSLSLNGAMNQISQSKGDSQILTQLGSSLSYVGNPLNFGNFSYNWNTGANASWQSSVGATPANTMTSAQASHNLSRIFTLSPSLILSFNGTQSINIVNSAWLGTTQSLTNTVSANLGMTAAERFSGSVSTMLSDVRTTGYLEQQYRVLNVGFFGQGQLSQISSASINLMFNWSDQSYKTIDSFGLPLAQNTQHMTLNGSASYNHMRFAGVRGLRYTLNFAADTRLRDDRLYGNVNGEIDRARFALTNRLDYRIGLLDLRLSLINNEVGGKKNALLFFQVSRQIGSY